MEIQGEIGYLVGIAWFAMCGAFVAIVLISVRSNRALIAKEREKEIAAFKAANDAGEIQKVRIAGDLHDGVIQLLTSIVQNINSNIRDFKSGRLSIENMTADKDTTIQLIDSIRSIALDLVPDVLINHGLERAIVAYVKKLNNDNRTVMVEASKELETREIFEKSDEVNLYRLCQELINNLTKHDRFTILKINFSYKTDNFIIEFIHDGVGITNEDIHTFRETAKGYGLKSIQSRALMLNANVDYSISEESALIKVTVPIRK
jgi:two-component system NarL family sensor kinase